jgi:ferrous iron transport protein B
VLSEIGREIAPAFSPMGLDEGNWPATVGIFTGILAKEAVVGTLDSMYSAMAQSEARPEGALRPSEVNPRPLSWRAEGPKPRVWQSEVGQGPNTAAGTASRPQTETGFQLWASLAAAFASIPANLADSFGAWLDPLGLGIGEVGDAEAAAKSQGVASGTFGAMVNQFDGAAGAFAYLLFILLYTPCTAAMAAVYRETNPAWTLFVAAWTTGLAYAGATVFYQAAIFARQPVTSAVWIAVMVGLFTAAVMLLRWLGIRQQQMAFAAATKGT